MERTLRVLVAALVLTNHAEAQVVRVADTAPVVGDNYGDAARSPGAIVVAVATAAQLAVAVSTDGGQTWTRRPAPGPAGSAGIAVVDPFLIDLVSSDGSSAGHARSTDLGVSWSIVHALPTAFTWSGSHADVATSSGGVIAISDLTDTAELHVATSSDGGVTWGSDVTLASGFNVAGYSTVTWLNATDLLACWAVTPASLVCARSTDAGATFAGPVEAARMLPNGGGSHALLHGAALRGPSEIILGVTGQRSTTAVVTRSSDGGASWSPLQTLATTTDASWTFSRPSVSAGSGGEVWLASTSIRPSRPPDRSVLMFTGDGVNWTPAPRLPVEISCAHPASEPQVLASGPGEVWYRASVPNWSVPSGTGWRTLDGAQTWDPPVDLGATLTPTQGVRVTRISGGRLVSLWIEGTSRPARLLASTSDDDGITWSTPPLVVSDAVVSERADYGRTQFELIGPPFDVPHRYPRFDVTALQGGGLIVVWLARGAPASCGQIRSTLSNDGSAFAPSVVVNDFDGFPLSVTEDGAQVLASTWFLGGDLVSARSVDGGATWSQPLVIRTPDPLDAAMLASEVATLSDGSLGIGVVRNGLPPSQFSWGDSTTEYYASRDGAQTWALATSRRQLSAIGYPPVLVNAGPRLLLTWDRLTRAGADITPETLNLESTDNGQSFAWRTTDPFYGGPVPPRPLLVGDSLGNIYWTWPNDAVFEHKMGQPSRELVGFLPENALISSTVEPSLLATTGTLAVLFADWATRPPEGVFYTQIPCNCRLTAVPPPTLTSCDLSPVTLSVAATPNARYQWYDALGPIPGATAPDLTLSAPMLGASYRAWVYNDCSGLFTGDTLVTIAQPPSVVTAPGDVTTCEGSSLQLALVATDTTAYQWFKNGLPIPGATAASFTLSAAVAGDSGDYTVAATGPCGVASPPAATVAVDTLLGAVVSDLRLVHTASDLSFYWTDVSVARSYEVREDATASGSFASVTGSALNGWPGVTVALSAATVFYRLAGVNACGSGAP